MRYIVFNEYANEQFAAEKTDRQSSYNFFVLNVTVLYFTRYCVEAKKKCKECKQPLKLDGATSKR